MTGSVLGQRLENEPRRDAASDGSLDHLGRPQMAGETPGDTHEPRLAVSPTAERAAPKLVALPFERAHHTGPQFPELVGDGAGPGGAHKLVELALPVLVDLVWTWRPGHEAADALSPLRPFLFALRELRVNVEGAFNRIAQEGPS